MLATALRRQQAESGQRGFTLLELMVAMLVMALIMGAICTAFITGLKTTNGLGTSNANTADVNLLSAYFPSDVMSMAGPTYDPTSTTPTDAITPDGWMEGQSVPGRSICGSDPLDDPLGHGIYSFNSQWDPARSTFDRTVTYSAQGRGADAQLVRRQCTAGASPVMQRAVVAQHFGSDETGNEAEALVGIGCDANTCTLKVNGKDDNGLGTYDYVLTARRRVPGVEDTAPKPPCTPTAPSVTPGFQENFVQWSEPVCDGGDPITTYEVRDTPPGTSNLFSATVFSHTYTGLDNGRDYTYEVRAKNANGWSKWSAESLAGVPAYSPPGPPTVTGSVPGNKRLTISWVPPASDGGKPITGYVIRATNAGGDVVSAPASAAATSGVIIGLENGDPDPLSEIGAYSITVAAVNVVGEGRESAPFGPNVSTKPVSGTPGAPLNVVATAQPDAKGHATVTWNVPLDDGGSFITGYQVSSNLAGFTPVDVPVTVVQINSLPTATAITFFVRACNAVGCGSPSAGSNSVTLTWTPEKIIPAPVLTGTGIAGQGLLSWSAPNLNGSNPVGYRIVLNCTNTSGTTTTTCPRQGEVTNTGSTGTTYTLLSQPAGGVRYTVAAINGRGTGPASDLSNSDILGSVPNEPTSLVAKPTGVQGQVSLTFTPPTNTGGRPIVNYLIDVYRGLANDAISTTALGSPFPKTSPDAAVPVLIDGLEPGYYYQFKVRTFNGVDTSRRSLPSTTSPCSQPPPAACGLLLTPVPNPPTSVIATDPAFASGGISSLRVTPASQPPGTPQVIDYTITCTNCPQPRSYVLNAQVPPEPATYNLTIGAGRNSSGTPLPTALPNGIPLTFTVHARNSIGAGAESVPSAPVTLYGYPAPPSGLVATATGAPGSVLLSWPTPDDGGKPITAYTINAISCGGTCSKKGIIEAAGSASPYLVTGLTNGTPYTFRLTATNDLGTSARGGTATATPITNAQAPVIGIAGATGVSGQAVVRWTPPSDNGGNAITGYRVTASTGEVYNVAGAATATLTVNGLADGPSITFTVQAINSVGASAASAPSNSIVSGTIPGAPTDVSAVATKNSGEIRVTWTAAQAHGPALTQNAITAHCTCTADGTSAATTGPQVSLLMGGLPNGETFTFTVSSSNAFGPGPASAESNVATPIAPPSPPLDVTAAVTSQSGNVVVSWNAPANSNGSPVTSYDVYASTGAVLPSVTDTTVVFGGLDNGASVTFQVQAFNDAGASALSVPSNAVSPRGLPDAPTSVVATPTGISGQVTVSWTVPADNGAAITGYRILDSNGIETTVGPGSSALVTGLDEGTPVSFTVAAINDAGQSPDSSPSGVITPAGVPDAPTNVVATVSAAGTVTLTFNTPNGHGATVTGYTVTIGCTGGTCTRNGQEAAITNGGTVTGLGEGGTASFSVVATNSSGTGVPGTSNTVAIPTKPGAPTGVTAVLTGLRAQVTVSWTLPASTGGSPITGYELVSINTGQTFTFSPPATPTFTVPRATLLLNGVPADGQPVSFKLRAVNMVGPSPDSNSTAVLTLPATANPPAAASITITPTGTPGQVDVAWTAPTNNGRSPIVGYHVTILATGGAKNGAVEDTVIGFPAVTTLRISGLTIGKSYTFKVASRNDVYPPPPAAGRSGASTPYVMT